MITKETISFLTELKENNNKPWFDANKKRYEAAKANVVAVAGEIINGLTKLDKRYGEIKPEKAVFRIYRDIRFSKDKTPYKTNLGAGFGFGGKDYERAGFYLHIQPGNVFVGGGCWQPAAPTLKAIRQEIDYNFKEFKSILDKKEFKKWHGELGGDKLKNPPKGYEKDNPALEYLKHTSFTATHQFSDAEVASPKFAENVLTAYKAMNPLIEFLNRAGE